jgi:hypothetical protein
MDGYNKDFSNYESFTESQHKAVTFIDYCKTIRVMGIYEYDIGEPDDSGTHRFHFRTSCVCLYVFNPCNVLAVPNHLRRQKERKIRDTNINVTS